MQNTNMTTIETTETALNTILADWNKALEQVSADDADVVKALWEESFQARVEAIRPCVAQEYTSADTSINSSKMPRIYSLVDVSKTGSTIDFGCGRYFDLYDLPENVVGHDPYNLPRPWLLLNHYDTALCSNVLNVIAEEEARHDVLETLASLADTVYITVYDGDGSADGRQTKKDCYQLNRKVRQYLPELQQVFSEVTLRNGLFTCRR